MLYRYPTDAVPGKTVSYRVQKCGIGYSIYTVSAAIYRSIRLIIFLDALPSSAWLYFAIKAS